MVKRNRNTLRIVLALLAGLVLGARSGRRRGGAGEGPADVRPPMLEPVSDPQPTPRRPRPASVRLLSAAAFTLLFFAGAAFTAGAGDRVAAALEGDDVVALDEVGAVAAGETPAALAPPAAEPAAPVSAGPVPVPDTVPDTVPVTVPETVPETAAAAPTSEPAAATLTVRPEAPAPVLRETVKPPAKIASVAPAKRVARPAVERAEPAPARPAEIERDGAATIWLNRALPDPTPRSARLTRTFTRSLVRTARREGADWASVLGVLRAEGARSSVPASPARLDRLATSLREDSWRGALSLSGRTTFADRAEALADLYRAEGTEALVTGLEASKERLTRRLLDDERVTIYAAGRADLEAGRIDVRIVVLLEYLAERHGSITVSSLFAGHRTYARPGVVSAHVYGHAVDIAAVGGLSIAGNQEPGGRTEEAVRSILLLPVELQPQQVISLLGLGGPSFPLADHADHIHVGY